MEQWVEQGMAPLTQAPEEMAQEEELTPPGHGVLSFSSPSEVVAGTRTATPVVSVGALRRSMGWCSMWTTSCSPIQRGNR